MESKSIRRTIIELIRKGENPLNALKKAEDSSEFKEEEIQEWYSKFNEYNIKSN